MPYLLGVRRLLYIFIVSQYSFSPAPYIYTKKRYSELFDISIFFCIDNIGNIIFITYFGEIILRCERNFCCLHIHYGFLLFHFYFINYTM